MGSGGTEWDTADTFDHTRLNQKTRFVGKGSQATSLILSPQTGQNVYCTESDSTFTIDKMSTYDTSGAWITPNVDETAEQTQTLGDSGSGVYDVTVRRYQYFTLPTTEKWYVFTALEAFPGNSITASIYHMGVDLVDAIPPTNSNTLLIALCPQVTKKSTDTTKVSTIMSKPVRGGTKVGVWASHTAQTPNVGLVEVATPLASQLRHKTVYDVTPNMADNTSWSAASTAGYYMKAYYRGYN